MKPRRPPHNALDAYVLRTTNYAAIAAQLGLTREAVRQWIKAGHVPAEWVVKFEKATGLSREFVRPDLYEHSADPLS